RDVLTHLVGFEEDGFTALGEHLADQPLRAADGHLGKGVSVLEKSRSTLGGPACRDASEIEDPCAACVAESAGLEGRTRHEALLRELRAPHPVEPEAALGVT